MGKKKARYFDPRDFFPHMKGYIPDELTPMMPLDFEAMAEQQMRVANPVYWMHMGQAMSQSAVTAPWMWYGMMLGTMEAMRSTAGNSKKIDKHHREAQEAVRKFAKHVAGEEAVKPPKALKSKQATKSNKLADTAMSPVLSYRNEAKSGQVKGAKTGEGTFGLNGTLPHTMPKPRAGKGDDLSMISGIGPKIAQTLNGLGIWHWDQIAAWQEKEIAWVDDYLKFSGRVVRENWIKQAEALAHGGAEHYRKIFGKEPR